MAVAAGAPWPRPSPSAALRQPTTRASVSRSAAPCHPGESNPSSTRLRSVQRASINLSFSDRGNPIACSSTVMETHYHQIPSDSSVPIPRSHSRNEARVLERSKNCKRPVLLRCPSTIKTPKNPVSSHLKHSAPTPIMKTAAAVATQSSGYPEHTYLLPESRTPPKPADVILSPQPQKMPPVMRAPSPQLTSPSAA